MEWSWWVCVRSRHSSPRQVSIRRWLWSLWLWLVVLVSQARQFSLSFWRLYCWGKSWTCKRHSPYSVEFWEPCCSSCHSGSYGLALMWRASRRESRQTTTSTARRSSTSAYFALSSARSWTPSLISWCAPSASPSLVSCSPSAKVSLPAWSSSYGLSYSNHSTSSLPPQTLPTEPRSDGAWWVRSCPISLRKVWSWVPRCQSPPWRHMADKAVSWSQRSGTSSTSAEPSWEPMPSASASWSSCSPIKCIKVRRRHALRQKRTPRKR